VAEVQLAHLRLFTQKVEALKTNPERLFKVYLVQFTVVVSGFDFASAYRAHTVFEEHRR
jgi:hypothetical protein